MSTYHPENDPANPDPPGEAGNAEHPIRTHAVTGPPIPPPRPTLIR